MRLSIEGLLNSLLIFMVLLVSIYSFNTITVFVIILTLFIMLFKFFIKKKENNYIKINPYSKYLVLVAAFMFLQVLFLEKFNSTIEFFYVIIFGFIYVWIIINLLKSRYNIEKLYVIWFYVLIGTLIIAYLEINTGFRLRSNVAHPGNISATVGFYNQNNYSFYLAISLPIVLYFIQKNLMYKVMCMFVLLLMVYIVFMNSTRSILLIMAIFVLLILFFALKGRQKVIGIILLSVFMLFILNMDFVNEAYENVKTLNSGDDGSVKVRKRLTVEGINIAKNNMLFGVGPNNAENYMFHLGDKVHNFWLELLINHGIIFFCMFLYFILNSVYIFYKNFKQFPEKNTWPILGSILIFIPASLTPSTIISLPLTWFFVGVIISLRVIIKNE